MGRLVSKTLAGAIRYSCDPEMRRACFESLSVTNSFDAEKVLQTRIVEWIQLVDQPAQGKQSPPSKRQRVRQPSSLLFSLTLTSIFFFNTKVDNSDHPVIVVEDLDGWE